MFLAHSSFLKKKTLHFYDRIAACVAVCVFFFSEPAVIFCTVLRNIQKGRIYEKRKQERGVVKKC
jgi:hypothetical protein